MTRISWSKTAPVLWLLFSALAAAGPASGNRYVYLDESNPFYPNLHFPKLITPQWVGEPGVDAVVILAIDDMRSANNPPARYEKFLRPILTRLKQIDGRAPVSIMCNRIDPAAPEFSAWLREGLSLEVHSLTHPCPLLAKGDFAAAAKNYHDSVALASKIPGNKPAAFRMPCCDSINSPSPRFYSEIFNQTNGAGQFLAIDSSVMNVTTPKDVALPREWVVDSEGHEKFRKYLPFPSFMTTIEDYPYPYVIGRLCWEFPAMVPSDWEAFHSRGRQNPQTLRDWKAALDATVRKKGTFTFIFHPYGWMRPEQFVSFIDYAQARYGRRVKFLNFREAAERLEKNALIGQSLRSGDGRDNGIRLLDLDGDGYLDVVGFGPGYAPFMRLWNPAAQRWEERSFPVSLAGDARGSAPLEALKFGRVGGAPIALIRTEKFSGAWRFEHGQWRPVPALWSGLELDGEKLQTAIDGRDAGARLRDVDRDGATEFIISNARQNAVFHWSDAEQTWRKLDFELPDAARLVDASGRDRGVRFCDFNGDGFDDVIVSNPELYGVYLYVPKAFLGFSVGWSRPVLWGKRGEFGEIPMIVRGGAHPDNGVWFRSGSMWAQNEDTDKLPDLVDRRSFGQLLAGLQPPAKSPEESLKCIRVRPGFKVELVASEPLVRDPIAFEWGADGKLWVVEMGDYPLGLDGHGKPGGTVLCLEDTDGDGRYDKATVFLKNIAFPNGVYPWRNGVIISDAPEIFYAEDTNGDGRADRRVTLFRGFYEGNQQHRCNGFDFGLDNWLYGANGDSGGVVSPMAALLRPAPLHTLAINLRGHDFRFRPDDGEFEAIEGQTQYGRHRDDWGNWFANDNPIWLWHYYFPERYLRRNPYLAIGRMRRDLANYAESTRAYAISRPMQRFNDIGATDHVTSANSPTPYRDDLFGLDFSSSIFISEPVYNVVHREVVEPDGVSFTSHRAPGEERSEFLASTDNWFRPTMLKTGPDGALYIADMYRLVIEHPEWIPEDAQKSLDLRAGADKGRIYRVYPAGKTLRKIPRLAGRSSRELVASLESANGWERDTAQRLLFERADASVAPDLKKLLRSSPSPKTRLQALATLDGLGAIDEAALAAGLTDAHPAVRAHAVLLLEPWLREAARRPLSQKILDILQTLPADPNPRVRYQLAFSLGEWPDPRAAQLLAQIAERDRQIKEIQWAVMSSARPHARALASRLLDRDRATAPPSELLDHLIVLLWAEGAAADWARIFDGIAPRASARPAAWQYNALAAALEAAARRHLDWAKLHANSSLELHRALQAAAPLFESASADAGDLSQPDELREAALRALGRRNDRAEADLETVALALRPQNSPAVQRAAIAAVTRWTQPDAPKTLLAHWNEFGPDTRQSLQRAFLMRPAWTAWLIRALETKRVSSGQLDVITRQKLLGLPDADLRARAEKILQAVRADRRSVLADYKVVEQLNGDGARGRLLFRQNCAICHRLRGEGVQVGPDLGMVSNKGVAALLESILDPNRAVEARYLSFTAVLKDGREMTGVIAAETPNSLTLRMPGGTDQVLLRSDLESFRGTGLSLMPEGFESGLKPQDLADLIAFVRGE